MKANRKSNSLQNSLPFRRKKLREVDKLVRKELFKSTFSVTAAIIFFMFLLFMVGAKENGQTLISFLADFQMRDILFLVFFLLLFPILYWFLRKESILNRIVQEKAEEYSIKMAETVLVPDGITRINLINTRMGVYREFFSNLSAKKEAEFYASYLDDKLNFIVLTVRLKQSESYHFLDIITKEEFAEFCTVYPTKDVSEETKNFIMECIQEALNE